MTNNTPINDDSHKKRAGGVRTRKWLVENINLQIVFVLIIFGTILSDEFLTLPNITNILRQISVNGILACGFTFILLAGGFDLSLGANVSFCACLLIGFQNAGMEMYTAIVLVALVGMAIGALNGVVINLIRAELSDFFMVTLASSMLVFSMGLTYTKGFELYINDPAYATFGRGTLLGFIPTPFIVMVIAATISQLIMSGTRLGRSIYLVGGNKTVSFLSGINVKAVRLFVFVIGGFFCAIAALILTSRTTGASAYAARGYEFDAAIAAIIGGNVMGGGKGGMAKTMIGVAILGLMANIMNINGVASVVQMVIKGIVLILSIYIDSIRKHNLL